MCTLIGTSTNLIVADLNQQAIADGIGTESLHFFSPAAVGLPATLLGLIYMIIASPWLLPNRRSAVSVSDDPQQYTVEVQVAADGRWLEKPSSKPDCDTYLDSISQRFNDLMARFSLLSPNKYFTQTIFLSWSEHWRASLI